MDTHKGPSESQPEGAQKTRESVEEIVQKEPAPRELIRFRVKFGAWLAGLLLGVICALVVIFLVAWWTTRPSLAEVQQLFGASTDTRDVLDALSTLRRDHFDQVRDLFQLVVLSALVPLFTLLAGYAFGTREMVAPTGTPEKEEQE